MTTNIDTHNRISAAQLEHVLKLQLKALAKNPELAKVLPPLMVWGAPGLGKSSILQKVARDLNIGFIDVRLAQREPVDIRGLPVPKDDKVEWLVSADWPRDPESKGILLFDEITAADRSLQVAAYEFILDRRLGDLYKVPNGWYICAAGNRAEDRAVSTTMSSALANRFMHVELAEDVESWVAWALKAGIQPSVVGFLRFRPAMLFNQKGENLERGWPSPRAWERVSRMLEVMAEEPEEIVRKMVYGLVGNRAGVEFMEFRKITQSYDNALELMRNPNREFTVPVQADVKYALCSGVAYHVWRGESEAEAKLRLDGFYRISLKLPSDFSAMLMMDAMTGGGILSEDEARERLFIHEAYQPWVERHGESLRKHLSM